MAGFAEQVGDKLGISADKAKNILGAIDVNIDPAISMVGSIAFITGLLLLVYAIKRLTGLRSAGGNDPRAVPGGIIATFVAAVVLINAPAAMEIVRETMFKDENLSLSKVSKVGNFGSNAIDIIKTIMHFIQFVGVYAFIKGVLVLNKVANGGGQEASVGKGVTHILGGIFATNIVVTVNMLAKLVNSDFQLS